MPLSKAPHIQYSEIEAAEQLGVSVEHFRTLVRNYIVTSEDEISGLETATFKQSDLVVLKILVSQVASVSLAS
jgi:hypothetical protein